MSCETCKFAHEAHNQLWCRRNPPQCLIGPNGFVAMWPPVQAAQECGEFRAGRIIKATVIPQIKPAVGERFGHS